jgi:hypothetical protein
MKKCENLEVLKLMNLADRISDTFSSTILSHLDGCKNLLILQIPIHSVSPNTLTRLGKLLGTMPFLQQLIL